MKNILIVFICICFTVLSLSSYAQSADRWQQKVNYSMEIDFDVESNQFSGKQSLEYFNNSPDELHSVYYHLYFNAFQPGSMMDVRSQSLPDADSRVADRIGSLTEAEIGYHKIISLKQDGKDVKYKVEGTILEVELNQAIKPGSKTNFEMEFSSQVPVQIRRSGRDNKEGISYSMTQWYPKMCEYDYQGWHANPYVGREFHGVWGNFDVKISIDQKYTLGASGYLQNPNEIGHGYGVKSSRGGQKIKWHFIAPNVHDFAWAADAEYVHKSNKRADGLTTHFIYQENENTKENWEKLPAIMDVAFDYVNKRFGQYPYDQYTFIQGGDGGMEYAMITLITGERKLSSLVGVSVHELMHSWYQMVLGTNESLYAWMDEGFTSFATNETMAYLRSQGLLGPKEIVENPHLGSYKGYGNLAASGVEEPMTTHADHFNTNFAYGQAAYSKGAVFLNQLSYIVGQENFDQGMLSYFDQWKFKHPNPNDFIRVMEKQAKMELDWYYEYWVQTTKTIDYGIGTVSKKDKNNIQVVLEKNGLMPIPIDLVVTDKKDNKHYYTIPLRIMRGEKTTDRGIKYELQTDWPWTNTSYSLALPFKIKKIKSIEIDPSKRIADLDESNNRVELQRGEVKMKK